MTNHRGFRARPLHALAAALIIAASLLAAAPSASASGPYCDHDSDFNACLWLDWNGTLSPSYWTAQVGIDVHLPEQYGREIIACGNSDFQASLWGDDGGGDDDDFIRNLDLKPGWPAPGTDGIGAEFIQQYVDQSDLDEDDGQDEIYARISYHDCHLPHSRFEFRSGTFRANF
jgi:hypothetical protein